MRDGEKGRNFSHGEVRKGVYLKCYVIEVKGSDWYIYALIYLRKQYVSVFFDRKGDLQTAHFQYNSLRNIFKF